jgi:hypothetical protein
MRCSGSSRTAGARVRCARSSTRTWSSCRATTDPREESGCSALVLLIIFMWSTLGACWVIRSRCWRSRGFFRSMRRRRSSRANENATGSRSLNDLRRWIVQAIGPVCVHCCRQAAAGRPTPRAQTDRQGRWPSDVARRSGSEGCQGWPVLPDGEDAKLPRLGTIASEDLCSEGGPSSGRLSEAS